MRQPSQVLVYPVKATDSDWEVLLLHRVTRRGGFWQGVTGGVEQGEELIEAAKRELAEETGLMPAQMQAVGYAYSFPVADQWRHLYDEGVQEICEHVFVAHLVGPQEPILDPREHDQWLWCSLDQALELLTWPENIEALRRCANVVLGAQQPGQ